MEIRELEAAAGEEEKGPGEESGSASGHSEHLQDLADASTAEARAPSFQVPVDRHQQAGVAREQGVWRVAPRSAPVPPRRRRDTPTDASGRIESSQGAQLTPRSDRPNPSGLPVNNPLGLNSDP